LTLVYVDSSVLIAAAKGGEETSLAALVALDEPEFQFASSQYVQLECLPNPYFIDEAMS
jgi:hypothetical protein